jgi:hypothetical protein
MAKKWLQDASAEMARKGTEGSFTKQAKKAGETPEEFAATVLKPGSKASTKTKRRAAFVKAIGTIARKHAED